MALIGIISPFLMLKNNIEVWNMIELFAYRPSLISNERDVSLGVMSKTYGLAGLGF
jgi:hypothetical protein